jgi:hypothetical protein
MELALPSRTGASGILPGNFLSGGVSNEKAEGLFSYRIADRRGDHSDHRGHRNPQLD